MFIRRFKPGVIVINKSFLNWYTQSLGGMVGILICIWSYLQGDMVVYGNILNNVDSVSFGGFLASFILIPLCIIVTILGAIEAYSSNNTLKTISNCIIILTTIIGFLGSKIYFIIPSIFILFKFYSTYIIPAKKENVVEEPSVETTPTKNTYESSKIRKVAINENIIEPNESEQNTQKEQTFSNEKTITFKKNSNQDILETRLTMAKELLSKNANTEFICELTGLTLDQVDMLKQDNN